MFGSYTLGSFCWLSITVSWLRILKLGWASPGQLLIGSFPLSLTGAFQLLLIILCALLLCVTLLRCLVCPWQLCSHGNWKSWIQFIFISSLDVTFDRAYSFDKHVGRLVQTCFCHLKSISHKYMAFQCEMQMITHAFISSHLDYCDLLFTCLSKSSLFSCKWFTMWLQGFSPGRLKHHWFCSLYAGSP